MAFGSLKKWLEGAVNQVNPWDNGKTWDTTVNQQQPGYRQVQAAQGQQWSPSVANRIARPISNQFREVGTGIGLGGLRSLEGTAQGLSGLYDLLTPGHGTNRVSKGLDSYAKFTDATAKAEGVGPSYKIGQFGTDVLQFLAGGELAKAAAKVPTVSKVITPINKVSEFISNPITTKLGQAGVKGRIVAPGVKALLNPAQTANTAAFTALTTGQDASKGRDISPKRVAANFAQNELFNVGLPMAGQAGRELVNSRATQVTSQAVKKVATNLNANTIANKATSARQIAEARLNTTHDKIFIARQNGRSVVTLQKRLQKDQANYWKAKAAEKLAIKNRDTTIGLGTKRVNPSESIPQGSQLPKKSSQEVSSFKIPSNKGAHQTASNRPIGSVGSRLTPAEEFANGQPVHTKLEAGTSGQLQISPATGVPLGSRSSKSQKLRIRGQGELQSQSPPALGGQRSLNTEEVVPSGSRKRGFVNTIINDQSTDPRIKDSISSLYKVRNTKELQAKAATFVKENPTAARAIAGSVEDDKTLAIASSHWANEQAKAARLKAKGDAVGANGVLDEVLKQQLQASAALTKAGQFSQAASVYGKTTPEGILRFTQNELNKYNKAMNKNLKLSPEDAAKLDDMARRIQGMTDGRDKNIAIQEMLKNVYDLMPSSWTQKAATLQTIAQLLNPKTLIRNIGGNTIFGGLENISQTIAAPIDKATSLFTNQRTTKIPSLTTQGRGLVRGLKEGSQEAWRGIQLGLNTQFELNKNPVFKNKVLNTAERTMGVALQGPDRAAYTAAFDDTLRGLMKANNVKSPTAEMLDLADYVGKYRTFQDDSKAAKVFTKMKAALNHIGFEKNGHAFGLGDFILKYPKTPANLLSRGIDYSPVGLFKGLFEIARPAMLNQPFNQHAFANSLARGIVGTGGLVGAGAMLGGLGIITPQPDQNKNLRNLQKTAGLGGYQINTSALKRFILGGFNVEDAKLRPGDQLVSYDWAQPIAIPLSAGAAAGRGEGIKKGATQSIGGLAEGVNTLFEQPLVQGMLNFSTSMQEKGLVGAFTDTAVSAPPSFIPTGINQINQLLDNTTRNTYDPNPLKQSINKFKAKIPGLASTLPASIDVLGREKERYQGGSNNPFNVFFNPAFVSNYKPTQTAKEALGLYQRTGETKQVPNTATYKVKINGENQSLNAEQQSNYQNFVGQLNVLGNDILSKNPKYSNLTDEQRVNLLSSLQTDINSAAKIRLFEDNPDKVSKSVNNILNGNIAQAIEDKLNTREKVESKKTKIKVKNANKRRTYSRISRGGRGRKLKLPNVNLASQPAKGPTLKIATAKAPSGKLSVPKQKTYRRAVKGVKYA